MAARPLLPPGRAPATYVYVRVCVRARVRACVCFLQLAFSFLDFATKAGISCMILHSSIKTFSEKQVLSLP